jgi:type II secretory pathway pseudopilin PulG
VLKRLRPFTLTEVLASLVLLGLGMALLAQAMAGGSMLGRRGKDLTLAALLAQSKMEEALALAPTAVPEQLTGQGQGGDAFAGFAWERQASVHSDRPGLCQVNVTVTWKERRHERRLVLSSAVRTATREDGT